ncbi:uncharacterized protein V6R79_004490 [Siganus canaliculatus]
MHQTQNHHTNAKWLRRKNGLVSSVKGVSHLPRRAKRRLHCKLKLWLWRKRRERCHFWIFRAKKKACGVSPASCLSAKTQRKSKVISPVGCSTGDSEDTWKNRSRLTKSVQSVSPSEASAASSSRRSLVTDADAVLPKQREQCGDSSEQFPNIKDSLTHMVELRPGAGVCGLNAHFRKPKTHIAAQSSDAEHPTGLLTPPVGESDESSSSKLSKTTTTSAEIHSLTALKKNIHEFLDNFYRTYGSFIPLQKSDVLRHLKKKLNADFSDRKNIIFAEIIKYQAAVARTPAPSFLVVYRRHRLMLEDLATLADQNWLNDQVMNMYGDLIMEFAHHKVHFLNSFFHRQLMTKGYDGVKRWTKQVDLFSKALLLVPIHLEVHWCLVTADNVKKRVSLYDSQGKTLEKVARNILKYLMREAKEKKKMAFESDWVVSFNQEIPQQTNENDCGVFVLEYSRCLALEKPFQFSQKDIPNIRRRIYRELCDCRLQG